MAPHLARIALSLGILVLILALIPLPVLRPGTPEFVVDLLAVGASLVFISLVIWEVRRQGGSHTERRGNGDDRAGEEIEEKGR